MSKSSSKKAHEQNAHAALDLTAHWVFDAQTNQSSYRSKIDKQQILDTPLGTGMAIQDKQLVLTGIANQASHSLQTREN